jgi:hypothetical protein
MEDPLKHAVKTCLLNVDKQQVVWLDRGLACLRDLSQANGKLRLGTICTGSSIPEKAVIKFLEEASKHSAIGPIDCVSAIGCESNSAKSVFASRNHTFERFFQDAKLMGGEEARCVIAGGRRTIPGSDIAICGFSCKDLSNLSQNGRRGFTEEDLLSIFDLSTEYIADDNETTVPTLRGFLMYVKNHLPALVFIENLLKISKATDSTSFLGKLDEFFILHGYLHASKSGSPRDIGIPTSRGRCHAGYVHLRQVIKKDLSPCDLFKYRGCFLNRVRATFAQLQSCAKAMPLGNYLYDEHGAGIEFCA